MELFSQSPEGRFRLALSLANAPEQPSVGNSGTPDLNSRSMPPAKSVDTDRSSATAGKRATIPEREISPAEREALGFADLRLSGNVVYVSDFHLFQGAYPESRQDLASVAEAERNFENFLIALRSIRDTVDRVILKGDYVDASVPWEERKGHIVDMVARVALALGAGPESGKYVMVDFGNHDKVRAQSIQIKKDGEVRELTLISGKLASSSQLEEIKGNSLSAKTVARLAELREFFGLAPDAVLPLRALAVEIFDRKKTSELVRELRRIPGAHVRQTNHRFGTVTDLGSGLSAIDSHDPIVIGRNSALIYGPEEEITATIIADPSVRYVIQADKHRAGLVEGKHFSGVGNFDAIFLPAMGAERTNARFNRVEGNRPGFVTINTSGSGRAHFWELTGGEPTRMKYLHLEQVAYVMPTPQAEGFTVEQLVDFSSLSFCRLEHFS